MLRFGGFRLSRWEDISSVIRELGKTGDPKALLHLLRINPRVSRDCKDELIRAYAEFSPIRVRLKELPQDQQDELITLILHDEPQGVDIKLRLLGELEDPRAAEKLLGLNFDTIYMGMTYEEYLQAISHYPEPRSVERLVKSLGAIYLDVPGYGYDALRLATVEEQTSIRAIAKSLLMRMGGNTRALLEEISSTPGRIESIGFLDLLRGRPKRVAPQAPDLHRRESAITPFAYPGDNHWLCDGFGDQATRSSCKHKKVNSINYRR
jgi:hypothetical protein